MNSRDDTAWIVAASARRAFDRRGDVENDELVDSFDVVPRRERRRIACALQILEADALHDLAVADVEARDDALRQHYVLVTGTESDEGDEVLQEPQACNARLFGMKLHAEDAVALDDRREVTTVRREGDAVGRYRRGIRMSEIDLRSARRRRRADGMGE